MQSIRGVNNATTYNKIWSPGKKLFELLRGYSDECLNLSWAYSERNRKCYNLRDSDLPKRKFVTGTEGIEDWRCFY